MKRPERELVGEMVDVHYQATQRDKQRAAVKLLPVAERPRCLHCNKALAGYRWRKPGSGKVYGNKGDNCFCGIRCGYKWALDRFTHGR